MSAPYSLDLVCRFLRHFRLHDDDLKPTNYSAHPIGNSGRWWLVHVAGRFWFVSDNGGELLIEQANGTELARKVPLTWFGSRLNEATVAQRVASVIRGQPIDFSDELTDEDQQILLGVVAQEQQEVSRG